MLHMGHMLNNTLQDVLVRRARMQGKNACWVPGTDHASIATEAKVVAKLKAEGIEKSSLSREEFLRHAWDWKEKYGGVILQQLRKLGASCDWERTCFTMDEARTESVLRVFCDLYEKGLIYRGVRMVNWDPSAQTALSDEEVVFKESHGKLYYLRYRVEGTDRTIIVATTRPETILGDTALCVNPDDERYAWLPEDARVIVPLVGRSVPVIRDTYVDIAFGTGALKVTPAHDVNDYMLGEKYGLESIDIFNDDGTINDKVGLYAGMERFALRKQIEKDLDAAGLLEKTEDYTNNVGYSERTGVAIEPKLSMQWFLSMEKLAGPATRAVLEDEIKLVPEKYKNTYRHWMENIKDWCISRQLWWGQRIPAWYLPQGGYVVALNADEALEKARAKSGDASLTLADLRQDADVYSLHGGDAGKCVDYTQLQAQQEGYKPYYMYRQKNTVGNYENVGFALEGAECRYNIYMMEEVHTIFAAGAGAVTKMVDYRPTAGGKPKIERLFYPKYPYEYLRDESTAEKLAAIETFCREHELV